LSGYSPLIARLQHVICECAGSCSSYGCMSFRVTHNVIPSLVKLHRERSSQPISASNSRRHFPFPPLECTPVSPARCFLDERGWSPYLPGSCRVRRTFSTQYVIQAINTLKTHTKGEAASDTTRFVGTSACDRAGRNVLTRAVPKYQIHRRVLRPHREHEWRDGGGGAARTAESIFGNYRCDQRSTRRSLQRSSITRFGPSK